MIAAVTATMELPARGGGARLARRYLAALGALRGAVLAGHRVCYVDAPPFSAGRSQGAGTASFRGITVVAAGPDPAGLAGTAWRLAGCVLRFEPAAVPVQATATPDVAFVPGPCRRYRLTITGSGPVPMIALPHEGAPAPAHDAAGKVAGGASHAYAG